MRRHQFAPDIDDQITVTRVAGSSSVRSGTVENVIKILVRSKNPVTAETDVETVYGLMHNQSSFLSTPTQLSKALSPPFFVALDENDRYVFSLNFLVRTSDL